MGWLVAYYNYHRCIGKKTVDSGYSALSDEIESGNRVSKLNTGERLRITMQKIAKFLLKTGQIKGFH